MQQLHLVGFTTELDGLIFSAREGTKSGGYLVALDDRFLSLIARAVRLRTGVDPADGQGGEAGPDRPAGVSRPVKSALSPKEIQARLRAGRSVAEVAAEAGAGEDWVGRFAAPVLAEQAQVLSRALALPSLASHKGESTRPLAVSVAWNLMDRGLRLTADELAGGWTAYHLRESQWVVRFRFLSRRRAQTATWEYDAGARTVVALNRLASELGYVEPRRHRPTTIESITAGDVGPGPPPLGPAAAPAPRKAVRRALAGKAPAKNAAVKRAAVKAPAGAPAEKPPGENAPADAPAEKAPGGKAPGEKAPARSVAVKAPVGRAPAKSVAVKKAAGKAPAGALASETAPAEVPASETNGSSVSRRARPAAAARVAGRAHPPTPAREPTVDIRAHPAGG